LQEQFNLHFKEKTNCPQEAFVNDCIVPREVHGDGCYTGLPYQRTGQLVNYFIFLKLCLKIRSLDGLDGNRVLNLWNVDARATFSFYLH
jgi:hypothetical protein